MLFFYFTMVTAIQEVDDQAKSHPDKEPDPCGPRQGDHEVYAHYYTSNSNHWIPGHPELPWDIWLCAAQNKYTDRNKDKCKQSTNIGQLSSDIDIDGSGANSNQDTH